MWALRDQLISWQLQNTFHGHQLLHAEVGYRQHAEFFLLFWLRRLIPYLHYVITVHDPPLVIAPLFNMLSFGFSNKFIWKLMRTLDYTPMARSIIRDVLDHAAAVFVLSERGSQSMQGVLRKKERVHALPFVNYESQIRKRQSSMESKSPIRILFIGFWGPSKGIETLILAMERLLSFINKPVELLFAGGLEPNGQNREYVEKIIGMVNSSSARNSIKLLGYIPDEQLSDMLDKADIMALPYLKASGFSASSVLIRAMSSGLAIVASKTGMLDEEIKDNETGLLVQSGDVQALTDALQRLIGEDDLRHRLGQTAQKHVFTEHSQCKVAGIVADIYDEVAGSSI